MPGGIGRCVPLSTLLGWPKLPAELPASLPADTDTGAASAREPWVLSIGKLGRGAEGYYLQAVAKGVEDYYLGSGEALGRWAGSGSARLGLSGVVDGDDLRAVLDGRRPDGPAVAAVAAAGGPAARVRPDVLRAEGRVAAVRALRHPDVAAGA